MWCELNAGMIKNNKLYPIVLLIRTVFLTARDGNFIDLLAVVFIVINCLYFN